MDTAPAQEFDARTNFQRARRSVIMAHCRKKGISVPSNATKDNLLKILDLQPILNIPDVKVSPSDPNLSAETNDARRARLVAELAALDGPKVTGTKMFEPRTLLEDEYAKLDHMQHHERKKWLAKACEEKGIESRFPGPRGKGPEVLAECKRIAAM